MSLTVHPFFDYSDNAYAFIVANPESGCCAIVDPLVGVDANGADCTHCADLILDWVKAQRYVVRWILQTHAPHRPGALSYLKKQLLCAQTVAGAGTADETSFDRLVSDGDTLCLGHACGRVVAVPGCVQGSVSYHFEDFAFVGDVVWGPARDSVLALADDTRLFVCHYNALEGHRSRFVTTVMDEKQRGIGAGANQSSDERAQLTL